MSAKTNPVQAAIYCRLSLAKFCDTTKVEDQERIWEPFFTTKHDVGTGLGLWVCKQIIERHNGTIRAHSTPGGTVFTIVLPQRNNVHKSEAAS